MPIQWQQEPLNWDLVKKEISFSANSSVVITHICKSSSIVLQFSYEAAWLWSNTWSWNEFPVQLDASALLWSVLHVLVLPSLLCWDIFVFSSSWGKHRPQWLVERESLLLEPALDVTEYRQKSLLMGSWLVYSHANEDSKFVQFDWSKKQCPDWSK